MSAPPATPSLLIQTTYQLHLDDVEAFKDITERMAADARQRVGNTFLLAAQDLSNPALFHLTEGWQNQQAIEEHLASDRFQRVLAEAQQLRIESRSATVFEVGRSYALGLPT